MLLTMRCFHFETCKSPFFVATVRLLFGIAKLLTMVDDYLFCSVCLRVVFSLVLPGMGLLCSVFWTLAKKNEEGN